MNGVRIWQPDEGLAYNFETTYTSDSGRTAAGPLIDTPMFTVEQLGYTATDIPASEASAILQMMGKGQHFMLTYYSLYYRAWRTAEFYVGKGSASIGRLKYDDMRLDSLTFNMTGVDPL